MNWCVARTEPRREAAAARFLRLRGYEEVYVPRLREHRTRRGRRLVTVMPLFPSYLFLRIQDGRWWDARWCACVCGLIMNGGSPAVMTDNIIEELRRREVGGAFELPTLRLEPGVQVKILAGPLAGQIGILGALRPHERVLVLMSWLGKVELRKDAIEVVG
jgi:transcriptional antiterminator RfaH